MVSGRKKMVNCKLFVQLMLSFNILFLSSCVPDDDSVGPSSKRQKRDETAPPFKRQKCDTADITASELHMLY